MNASLGRLIPLVLIFIAAITLSVSAQTKPATQPAIPNELTILIYGDANSDAGQRTRTSKWPELLAQKAPDWRIVNRSRSGRALANESRDLNAVEAYNASVRLDAFDVVIVFLGSADVQTPYYEKKNAKRISDSLGELVLKIREHSRTHSAAILVCSPLPIFDDKLPDLFKPLYQGADPRILELSAEFARLSKDLKVTYADLHTPFLNDAADFADGIHAGNTTQAKIAALMPAFIRQAYQEKPDLASLPAITPKAATTAAATQITVNVEEDRSLTPEEYLKIGYPPVNREWGNTESERVIKLLTKMAAEDDRRLPRYNSPQSGKLFARLIPADTLKRMRDKSSPLTTRYTLTMDILNVTPQFFQIYRKASSNTGVFDREQTELLAYSLQFTALALDQIEEHKAQYGAKDPRMVTLAPRFQATTSEAARTLNTALAMFPDKAHFRITPLAVLADTLTDNLTPILLSIPEKERQDVIRKIEKIAADESHPDLKPALTRLAAKARG